MMPEMDGYEVKQRLLHNEETAVIPVIFVTALDEDLDEQKGLDLGAVDYITKPIKPAVLLARVRAQIEIKQTRDRLKNQNLWLEHEIAQRTKENLVIQSISLGVILELAESRDTETGNHIARTQAYIECLGKKLATRSKYQKVLTPSRLETITKAAPLHDIGKVGIPDRVLLKPGKLDPEEWAIMQSHSTIGAQVIHRAISKVRNLDRQSDAFLHSESLAVLEEAKVIALSHHEKWDGTGYPQGLAGEDIPLSARLMAIADVYDALTSARVYKKAWSNEEASAHILSQGGSHFDPEIVQAFGELTNEFVAIHRKLQDQEDHEKL
jgi:putative two-component system response regulator